MAGTSLSPEQEEYLECIVQSADHLKNVVSDILDFDQLKRGFNIQKEPVSVRECLYAALRSSGVDLTPSSSSLPTLPSPSEAHAFFSSPPTPHAESSVASVSPVSPTREVLPGVYCTVAEDVPQFILSDRDRIVQVLSNLIHNAIRFTNRQSRHVDIKIERVKEKERDQQEGEEKALSSSSSTSSLAASLELLPEEFHSPHASGELVLDDQPSGMQRDDNAATSQSEPLPAHSTTQSSAQSDATETRAQNVRLRVSVHDNGLGIDPKHQPEAFAPYFRSDTSLSHTYVGTGMGLSICKMVAGLLGGEMTLESEGKDKGTTITFTITAGLCTSPPSATELTPPSSVAELSSSFISEPSSSRRSSSEPSSRRSSTSPESSPSTSPALPHPLSDIQPSPSPSPEFSSQSPMQSPPANAFFPYKSPQIALPKVDFDGTGIDRNVRVLLVEDNLMNQKILLRLFEKLGIRPDVACNGDEAVELTGRKQYDIVFMDLHMPVCDGFEATKKIKSLPDTHPQPLIYALTASVSVEDRDKCLALGMKGHLPKPLSIRELIAVLKVVSVSD